MKQTTVVALGFLLCLLSFNISHAQSSEDPFSDDLFGDLFSELETFSEEPSEEEFTEDLGSEEPPAEDLSSGDSELLPTEDLGTEARTNSSGRDYIQEIPEGKEAFLLYQIPGAFEYRGMTFLTVDSPKYLNPYQPCDLTAEHVITDKLARLKISQGAPLECREDIVYRYFPYKTYRTSR